MNDLPNHPIRIHGVQISAPVEVRHPDAAEFAHYLFHEMVGFTSGRLMGLDAHCGIDHRYGECPECSADLEKWGDIELGHHPKCSLYDAS